MSYEKKGSSSTFPRFSAVKECTFLTTKVLPFQQNEHPAKNR